MNVFENIPYSDQGLGKRKILDKKEILVMQIALKSNQKVPLHNANSNVHLLVIEGSINVTLAGVLHSGFKGDIIPVAFNTPMEIVNSSDSNASFLVLKTPHPDEMTS